MPCSMIRRRPFSFRFQHIFFTWRRLFSRFKINSILFRYGDGLDEPTEPTGRQAVKLFEAAQGTTLGLLWMVLFRCWQVSRSHAWSNGLLWIWTFFSRVIFESENDFALCIKQSFPRLNTNKLRRKQWSILRGLIGKPRRSVSNVDFQGFREWDKHFYWKSFKKTVEFWRA